MSELTSESEERQFRWEIASTHKVLSRGVADLEVCQHSLCINHLIVAMIRWRRGESPLEDIELAVEAAHTYLRLMREGRAEQELFYEFPYPLLLLYAATGRFDEQLDQVMFRIPADTPLKTLPPFGADAALADAVRGQDEGLQRFLEHYPQESSRFASWYHVYGRVYAAGKSGDDAAFLANFEAAERSFLERPSDPTIEVIDYIEGGGWQNNFVIDFRLAALLRWYEDANGPLALKTMHRAAR